MEEIFISHHDDDAAAVHALAEDLFMLGNGVVFDRWTGGQSSWDEQLDRIRRCGIFIFAMTREGLRSHVNLLELAYAADLGKPILPVLLGDDVDTRRLPGALQSPTLVDCRTDTRRTGLQLARSLAVLPPAGPLPDPLPAPPAAPLWHLRDLEQTIDPRFPLDYAGQCVLLVRLQRALRDEETRSEALTLLARMKARPDVARETTEEIDYLLETSPASKPQRPPKSASAGELRDSRSFLRAEKTMVHAVPPLPTPADRRPAKRKIAVATHSVVDEPDVYVDPERRLMWTRKDNGLTVTWLRAQEYAEELSLAGYTDWRLPTTDELEALYQSNSSEPIKVRPPVTLRHRFAWSSERDGRGSAEGFDFCYGSRKRCYVDDSFLRVLCVRDLTD